MYLQVKLYKHGWFSGINKHFYLLRIKIADVKGIVKVQIILLTKEDVN